MRTSYADIADLLQAFHRYRKDLPEAADPEKKEHADLIALMFAVKEYVDRRIDEVLAEQPPEA
ncbi:MAG TPA: hypothetical protein VNL15_05995 [Dehalococcoidia bacterium]|nr:hypothetical protein [Dehalococcoidia bacterium]